mmetsp:Transcript_10599/g.25859  ORF Transcript_10599/g.25859 Transcript_10599/m.25859 type:complete len:211 (-) Transcript_10599:3411-4043(-)
MPGPRPRRHAGHDQGQEDHPRDEFEAVQSVRLPGAAAEVRACKFHRAQGAGATVGFVEPRRDDGGVLEPPALQAGVHDPAGERAGLRRGDGPAGVRADPGPRGVEAALHLQRLSAENAEQFGRQELHGVRAAGTRERAGARAVAARGADGGRGGAAAEGEVAEGAGRKEEKGGGDAGAHPHDRRGATGAVFEKSGPVRKEGHLVRRERGA